MQTFQEQRDFANKHWDELKAKLEDGGAKEAIAFIDGFADNQERRVMYVFARQGMVMQEWAGKNFEDYIRVAEAGMAECLKQAEAADDEEQAKKLTNSANVISYNLGADMAFCWGDDMERTEAHFRRGEQAGDDCIRWRKELGNPPFTLYIAYWLRGIHRLALKNWDGAIEDFEEALRYAVMVNQEEGKSLLPGKGNETIDFNHGWVELARWGKGESGAKNEFEKMCAVMQEGSTYEDSQSKQDAEFYLGQLRESQKQLGLAE